MTTDFGSTVPRRQLGRYLRRLREDGQVTIKAAAEALEWSPQKIWRIENGAVAMRSHDVETMCRIFGANADTTEALVALARETKARGWWQEYGDAVTAGFHLFIGLESAASRLRDYAPELIPGLLQTKAYAREVMAVEDPTAAESEREGWTAVRLHRQAVLERRLPAPPHLDAIINEHVLRRPLHDREAMAGQLNHLLDMIEHPQVTIRVLPMSAGIHAASTAGAFVLFDFPRDGGREPEPPTVFRDGLTGGQYADKPAEVEAYAAAWNGLERAVLSEGESKALIKAVAEEYAP